MQIPLQISFRKMEHSDAVASVIKKKATQLERYYPRMTSMRVVVESSSRRHQGNLFHVRIDITIPGHEIVVGRNPPEHQAHQDAYVAIRDAFRAARRQIEDQVRIHFRGRKPHREVPPSGRVVRLVPEEDCGFLSTPEGHEIYFHRNSVLNKGFEKLQVGDEVRFAEKTGVGGLHASTVKRIAKSKRSWVAAS